VKKREVVFSPEALTDLIRLYDYIAESSGAARAIGYIERIETHCLRFDTAAQRGTRRDDIRPGLRLTGFERRVTIAFHVDAATVTIDRILYGGRDIEGTMSGKGECRARYEAQAQTTSHSPLRLAALMIGHHFSASAF
jgi:toxin ParE1/3/4